MDARDTQRSRMRSVPPATWPSADPETQVFVDHSGRRARGVRFASFALAALCAFWLAGLMVGMTDLSSFPVGRSLVGGARVAGRPFLSGVHVLVRSPAARATIPRVGVRELTSGPPARRQREVVR